MKTILFVFVLLIVVLFIGVRLSGVLKGSPPDLIAQLRTNEVLTAEISTLAPCSSALNCVLSEAPPSPTEGVQFAPVGEGAVMIAWKMKGSSDEMKKLIKGIIAHRGDAVLTAEGPNYLQFEFTTFLMGYVDDVEFLFKEGLIFYRSASRLGKSDLGANRKRLLELEFSYNQSSVN